MQELVLWNNPYEYTSDLCNEDNTTYNIFWHAFLFNEKRICNNKAWRMKDILTFFLLLEYFSCSISIRLSETDMPFIYRHVLHNDASIYKRET